jgi:hypothetical protein
MGVLLNPEKLVEFLKNREKELKFLSEECSDFKKDFYRGRLEEIQNLLSLIKTGKGKFEQ